MEGGSDKQHWSHERVEKKTPLDAAIGISEARSFIVSATIRLIRMVYRYQKKEGEGEESRKRTIAEVDYCPLFHHFHVSYSMVLMACEGQEAFIHRSTRSFHPIGKRYYVWNIGRLANKFFSMHSRREKPREGQLKIEKLAAATSGPCRHMEK